MPEELQELPTTSPDGQGLGLGAHDFREFEPATDAPAPVPETAGAGEPPEPPENDDFPLEGDKTNVDAVEGFDNEADVTAKDPALYQDAAGEASNVGAINAVNNPREGELRIQPEVLPPGPEIYTK